jgi:hypothetical protein
MIEPERKTMQARISNVKKPWGFYQKKDGTGSYEAMTVECELASGEVAPFVTLFEEKAIGEMLELEKNGQYWNVAKTAKKPASGAFDPNILLEPMRQIYKMTMDNNRMLRQLTGAEAYTEPTPPTPAPTPTAPQSAAWAAAKERFGKPAGAPEQAPAREPVPDHDDHYDHSEPTPEWPGDETINLDDIPF